MRSLWLLFSLAAAVSACTTSRPAPCDRIRVACETNASRPACDSLIPTDGSIYYTEVESLAGRLAPAEAKRVVRSLQYADSMVAALDEADAVWVYDNSGYAGNMLIGTDALVAIKGCTVLAQYDLIHYN